MVAGILVVEAILLVLLFQPPLLGLLPVLPLDLVILKYLNFMSFVLELYLHLLLVFVCLLLKSNKIYGESLK